MKKLKIGLIILSLFITTNIVKADTTNYIDNITRYSSISSYRFNDAYTIISNSNKTYYSINFSVSPQGDPINGIYLFLWDNEDLTYGGGGNSCLGGNSSVCAFYISNTSIERHILYNDGTNTTDTGSNIQMFAYNRYLLYDTNFSFTSENNFELTGFYSDNIILEIGDNFPKYKDLIEYSSWSEYENNHLENYTTVNLDNYEYVLLSLKNYNQTQAFQTNMQVKGQIGITPIYNYGQTSKDAVTGSQVQDRCNLNYENYTSYPFYIIQTDLQNNVIYAVKECTQDSSFKFDNTIFDVTYITAQNEENPTVTINGKTYNVIPYEDLPSTATKNEENNYIPGESGSATDTGGLDSAIAGAQNKLSEIWNTFTYFTSFIGQIFSSLPSEVHTVLLSAFTIMIILGIIKIFLGK